ncbi:N(5)-(carboxyethyl)ornithine synthase [uncultured Clostridium sp.]|uniref:N(5)-(carboxyethyl)ornithine synthase n=1 Tax=uncultured Clostridium sp. TaxID=59620 RepID=UPI0028EC08AE|nr:N(5)-(carboxyethyl)ornithine synthase [uncultured Clostridium sp.]
MRTIGFLISPKENEKRRAIVPKDILKLKNANMLYFQKGYGEVLGISDEEYIEAGANVVTIEEIFKKDVICDPKIGDGDYLKDLEPNKILFGWVHAVQNRELTDLLLEKKFKCIAWEDMFEDGRHSFWRNNEIAGEAAVIQAFQLHGIFPYNTKVAILGRGNTARGAYRILNGLGADITVYSRNMESLFKKEIGQYDVIVNAVLWDNTRKDHILYRKDLKRMKRNALIIDVSCDNSKAIETSIPTSIENPIYSVDGIVHYAVDHTPSLFYKTSSYELSREVAKYLDAIIEGNENNNKILRSATIISDGKIIDEKISKSQNRQLNKRHIA